MSPIPEMGHARSAAAAASDAARPRILLVTEQVKPGGKRSHVEALHAGLEAHGCAVELLDWSCLSLLERGWIAGPIRMLDTVADASSPRWVVPTLNQAFARHLRRRLSAAPDTAIVHVQEPLTYAAAAAVANGRPVALTVHGPIHREVASARGLELDHPTIRWLREIEAHAYREAHGVVSVDTAHAEYVRSFGRHDRLWVIPNFVDTRRFHPQVEKRSFPPDLEHWVAGRPVVLCPRRLVPKNGVDVAVRAAAVLRDRGLAAALVIVGDGPQRAELESLVRSLGVSDQVRLAGEASFESMPGWTRRADIVVVPSVPSKGVEEATSISALEAQACGRPVVASALGGLREIVEDGVTGILTPPGDAGGLADAIARLIAEPDLRTRIGEAGAGAVRERHDHVAGAARYLEVYRSLLSAKQDR